MTKEQLAQIRELESKATPGPWEVVSDLPAYAIASDAKYRVVETQNQFNFKHTEWRAGIEQKPNAEFIAASRIAIPQLLDHIEKLEKRNQIMREALENIKNHNTLDGAKYNNHFDAYQGVVYFAEEALKKEKEVV